MKVSEVMEKPVFISQTASKKEIMQIVRKNKNTRVFIVADEGKKFLGDIHEDNLFYMMIPNEYYRSISINIGFDIEKKFFAQNAKEIMRKHDISCNESDSILDAALKLASVEINEMPVLNEKKQVVGIITQGILLRYIDSK